MMLWAPFRGLDLDDFFDSDTLGALARVMSRRDARAPCVTPSTMVRCRQQQQPDLSPLPLA